ncbi:MAG: hypothetical protein Q7T55_15940, partial [Solirubrobacteraceae bacterium]|nr:hypothetical protein [Solirubrobacteraceae bacterium]
GPTTGAPAPARTAGGGDPTSRRRQQVGEGLAELARLRGEPELAEDLFAFLGLPFTATGAIVATRLTQIGDANRRRRPDRERSLTDELLIHARELLVDGDPAVYRAWLSGEEPAPEAPQPAGAPQPEPSPQPVEASAPEASRQPVEAAPPEASPRPAHQAKPTISFDRSARSRRPEPAAESPAPTASQESEPEPSGPPSTPLVDGVAATRDPDGTVVVTWNWPFGVTEAFVSVGPASGPSDPGPGGRKITNTKYELDGGARLAGVPAGATVRVHSGSRTGQGLLAWNAPGHARETIAA